MNQTIKRIYNLTMAYDDNANAANTGWLLIGGFKIYGCEIGHIINGCTNIRIHLGKPFSVSDMYTLNG